MTDTNPDIVLADDRANPLANYPHVRRAGDFLYVSGASSRKADGGHEGVEIDDDGNVTRDIGEQTRAVIQNIQVLLEKAGSGLHQLVDLTCFLVDMEDYEGFNEAYNEFFEADSGPTRTTVAVKELPHPHLLIEIKAVAFAPN